MKIKPEDLDTLRKAVVPLDTPERRTAYKSGKFPNAEKVHDLDKRYRWDLLWISRLRIGQTIGSPGDLNLYDYMDDSHIDSALRSLVPALGSIEPVVGTV